MDWSQFDNVDSLLEIAAIADRVATADLDARSADRADSMIIAAVVWQKLGMPQKALSWLLKIRESAPEALTPKHEALIQEASFEVLIRESPDYDGLRRRISDFQSLSRSNGDFRKGVVHRLLGTIHKERGEWEDCLREAEAEWSNRETSGPDCEAKVLGRCVLPSLWAGRPEKATAWLEEGKRFSKSCCIEFLLPGQIYWSLYSGDWSKADALSRQFLEQATLEGGPALEARAVNLRIRSLLVDSSLGDPINADHPARRNLRNLTKRRLLASEAFETRVLLLDYRLALLRWAAGAQPTDDLFYKVPSNEQRFRNVKVLEIQERLNAFKREFERTLNCANSLDRAFQTTWRHTWVNGRVARLKSIVPSV